MFSMISHKELLNVFHKFAAGKIKISKKNCDVVEQRIIIIINDLFKFGL